MANKYILFNLRLLLTAFAFFQSSGARAETSVTLIDTLIVQGEIVRIDVLATPPPDTVNGSFLGKSLPFMHSASGNFYTLLGVDMETKPGPYELMIKIRRHKGRGEVVLKTLRVVDAGFPVQELTLPPKKVFPDSAAQERIRHENALRSRKWSQWSRRPFWKKTFIAPVEGELGRFGNRRILNGVPRSPHSGADINASEGHPVLAPAAGKVLLTGDFFFSGGSVYLDHGLGLIGMFFHLSRIDVTEGEIVEQGQVIGAVGSTGRVTGPHLHWGVRWRGSRIDPSSILKLPLD